MDSALLKRVMALLALIVAVASVGVGPPWLVVAVVLLCVALLL